MGNLGIIPLFSWYHEVIANLMSCTAWLVLMKITRFLLALTNNTYKIEACDSVSFVHFFQSFDTEDDITSIHIPPLEMVIHYLFY